MSLLKILGKEKPRISIENAERVFNIFGLSLDSDSFNLPNIGRNESTESKAGYHRWFKDLTATLEEQNLAKLIPKVVITGKYGIQIKCYSKRGDVWQPSKPKYHPFKVIGYLPEIEEEGFEHSLGEKILDEK